MAQQTATNSFTGGLVLDVTDLARSNSTLSNALNATLMTFNGNEISLLNDMGNCKIINGDYTASLPEGYIPVGIIEYGGIIYIASKNYKTNKCQIGSFPSPNYDISAGTNADLLWKYQPLKVGLTNDSDCDLDTTYFYFSLQHPLDILAEQSFDGSVNLIINDNINNPKLINTGFLALADNTATIIKRIGSNNTNRYNLDDETSFKLETSLYRDNSKICNFTYNGTRNGGLLKVGNYVFYAVVCDKDLNESDILCESGVVSIFKGTDGDPFSVQGGIEDELTDKSVSLTVSPIDSSYNYIKLFYTRTSASDNIEGTTLAYKVNKLFPVNDGSCNILFTGYESQISVSTSDLNLQYFNADAANAQATCLNMLFLANVTEENQNSLEYEKLRNYSLKITPQLDLNSDFNLNSDYSYNGDNKNSYYNSEFIYNNTGYHFGEIYRFGIVYIRKDNSLTSVFDVCGVKELTSTLLQPTTVPTTIDEAKFYFNGTDDSYQEGISTYNSKGVSRISDCSGKSLTTIVGIKFNLPSDFTTNEFITLNYKGYFFVRLKRIPTMLALGYATNVCETSFLPSINVGYKDNALNGSIETDPEKTNKLYLYESFATGAFRYNSQNDSDDNFFPKKTATSADRIYMLNNNYKSRLFTLSDYDYAYLDKILSGFIAASMLSEVGYPGYSTCNTLYDFEVTNTDNSISEYVGAYFGYYARRRNWNGQENVMVTNMDSTANITMNAVIFKKVTDTSIINGTSTTASDGTVTTTPGLKDITFYYESKPSGDEYSSVDVQSLDNKENIKALWYPYYDSNTNSSSNNGANTTTNGYIGGAYNCMLAAGEDRLDIMYYKKSDTQIYYNINGDYYTLVFIAYANGGSLHRAFDALSSELNKIIVNKAGTSSVGSGLLMNDPTTPTFDGKYSYTDSIDSKDILKVKLNPMEQGAYAVFCPEYELNMPHYNSIFTGQSLKFKPLTKKTFLTPVNKYKDRHYIYKETTIASPTYYDGNGIGVNENISLVSLLHSQDWNNVYSGTYNTGNSNLITETFWPRDNHVYFSTKAADGLEISYKFAGPQFLAYDAKNFSTYSLILSDTDGNNLIECKCGTGFPFNIVRGVYGPYVGCSTYTKYKSGDLTAECKDISDQLVGIYIPGYSTDNLEEYFELRISDPSTYQAIGNRFNITDTPTTCYRGDCYINYYTHRVNRNFNDSTAPYNDIVIDGLSFLKGFSKCFEKELRTLDLTKDAEAAKDINLGDLDAIQLGSWVTFPVRSTMNTALRCEDGSYTDEVTKCGHNRTFYPLYALDAGGSNKIPESQVFNQGFNKSGSEKSYVNLNLDVFVKTYYKNRICYSNVLQNDTLSNGHRVFLASHYLDYTDLYGEIVKLINIGGALVIVCEHGIMLISIQERTLAGESEGGNVYINTNTILPEKPEIISDTYGSTWKESIIKTPYGVYGIDVESKKIWRTNGKSIELLSDFKILKFLNDNLTPSSDKPNIGSINIKSHYNKFKNDVMFTYYDILKDSHKVLTYDKAWNLCYNENMSAEASGNGWQTFYSWIPSYSANIGNCFLTLNSRTDYDIINDYVRKDDNAQLNYIWKHGLSERIPTTEKILPTKWYNEQHPFEFEYIVNENPNLHKIFDNLKIISNKAKPESFHYEVVGESYDFADDKLTMYYRLELTKRMYHDLLNSKMSYNEIPDLTPIHHTKSSAFPLYYIRLDYALQIYDLYKAITCDSFDYNALSGCELVYYKDLNEFRLCNHVKGVNVEDSLLRGNMRYLEDIWSILISPISVIYKNETWNDNKVPIAVATINSNETNLRQAFSEEYLSSEISGYTADDIQYWDISKREEIKIKDKYIKIKIRYTGDELAVIHGIQTLYTVSNS